MWTDLREERSNSLTTPLTSFQTDSQGPTPPGGGEEGGGVAEWAEGGQPVVRELWFIVVMTAVALLLLAIALGVLLHKVREDQ